MMASINGVAQGMEPPQKCGNVRENVKTKPNLVCPSFNPLRELTANELRQSADFRPTPTILLIDYKRCSYINVLLTCANKYDFLLHGVCRRPDLDPNPDHATDLVLEHVADREWRQRSDTL